MSAAACTQAHLASNRSNKTPKKSRPKTSKKILSCSCLLRAAHALPLCRASLVFEQPLRLGNVFTPNPNAHYAFDLDQVVLVERTLSHQTLLRLFQLGRQKLLSEPLPRIP